MRAPVVVVGVGNPWRGDDGVAWSVIDRLVEHVSDGRCPSVELVRTDGEAARLIESWDGRTSAIVIDAVVTGADVGAIIELDLTDIVPGPPPPGGRCRTVLGVRHLGSHGLGIADAAELARVLGRLPERLVVVGVEGHEFAEGAPLSPAVAAAVPAVVAKVEALIEELATCA